MKPKIILASASIGRKQLLEKLGVPFIVQVSGVNEDIIINQNPFKMLQMRAHAKADDVCKRLASSELGSSSLTSRKKITRRYTLDASYLIIAADSMAVLGNKTFGKAKDKVHAKKIVTDLMGKTHIFSTATCIFYVHNPSSSPLILRGEDNIPSLRLREGKGELRDKQVISWKNLTKTSVTLRNLDPSSLDAYVSRYDFSRFAAGYALNETPWDLVTKIDGSYTNVVGLPLEIILPIFRELKII